MVETLQSVLKQLTEMAGAYLPNLLGALGILVVGWLVAKILAALVRGALRRSTLDNRLAQWMRGDQGEQLQIERLAGKTVFYLVMLFVLVAFFQALELTIITEPLNALLIQVTEFAPRLLAAAGLLAVAWLVATVLKKAVAGTLSAADLDRRLGEETGVNEDRQLPLTNTVADAVYWLIWLLFLPAILGALALEGLLAPVQGLADKVLGFVPNIFAAALIFAVGWFVSRLVQRIVGNLLEAAGIDRLSQRVGLDSALGDKPLSGVIGLIVYVLILIPVLISSLNALELEAITDPASSMLGQILDAIPGLFAAALLLTLAYFVGKLVSELISNLLVGAGFDNLPGKLGLADGAAKAEHGPAAIVGSLIMIAIMLFAAIEAASLLGFEALAQLLAGFVVFAGQVVLGLIVLGVGLFLANLAANTIGSVATRQSALLALVARVAIIVLAAAMALRQMGLANEIINLAFGLLLGSIGVALALAFGLGSRELAGKHAERWVAALESPVAATATKSGEASTRSASGIRASGSD